MKNNYNADGTAPIRRPGKLIADVPEGSLLTPELGKALVARSELLGRPLTEHESIDVFASFILAAVSCAKILP